MGLGKGRLDIGGDHRICCELKDPGLVVDAVERNRMYLVPQPAAKIFWYTKRLSPCAFYGFFAFIMRMGWGRAMMYRLCKLGF